MSYNVLIVDDSRIIRKVMRRAVSLCGLDLGEIHEAGDGVEALELMQSTWIDVVLADLNMPRMGGVELIARMAEDSRLKATPVVVVTSDRNERRLARLREHGVRDAINKPFRPETLCDVLARCLGLPGRGAHHDA